MRSTLLFGFLAAFATSGVSANPACGRCNNLFSGSGQSVALNKCLDYYGCGSFRGSGSIISNSNNNGIDTKGSISQNQNRKNVAGGSVIPKTYWNTPEGKWQGPLLACCRRKRVAGDGSQPTDMSDAKPLDNTLDHCRKMCASEDATIASLGFNFS